MRYLKPKDIIAGMVILGYFVLKALGVNGALDPAIFLVLGYYFVKRQNGSDNGK